MATPTEVTVFVRDVAERGVKTAAQAAVLQIVAQGGTDALHASAFNLNWVALLGFALGGFVLSVLTSLASQPVANGSTASLLSSVVAVPSLGTVADVVASTVAAAVADPLVVAPAPVTGLASAPDVAPAVVNVVAPALPTVAPAVQ